MNIYEIYHVNSNIHIYGIENYFSELSMYELNKWVANDTKSN